VLAIVSVVLCGLIGIFYILRALFYPQKIWKEWHHPSQGNYFSAITICITLYGLLLLPVSVNGGGTLIWIGSIGQMLITVLRVSELVYSPISDEFLNPGVSHLL
jgi:tellurite resistance protein TehA-like permease